MINSLDPLDLLTDYLVWSDRKLIRLLEGLTEDEARREFNGLALRGR